MRKASMRGIDSHKKNTKKNFGKFDKKDALISSY